MTLREKKRAKMTPTLIELWIGNTFWCIIFAASGVWFCENKIAYLLGVTFGWLASLGLTFYMARSIRLLVDDLDEGRGDRSAVHPSFAFS